ncbi:type II toxin-antitoxin system antitoxin [Paenibacillus sp. CAU 1782]
MAKEKKAFPLRLDPEIHKALEQWAGDEFRSVNSHIEYLLREALGKAGRLKRPGPPPTDNK